MWWGLMCTCTLCTLDNPVLVACALCQQLTTLSISSALVTKLSHRAAATPGPEVRRECPMIPCPSSPLSPLQPATSSSHVTHRYHRRE